MNQKGFANIILIGIIVALVALGGYFAWSQKSNNVIAISPLPSTSSQADTANWKTYTNTKYGFELKYPQEWKDTSHNELSSDKENLFEFTLSGPTDLPNPDPNNSYGPSNYASLSMYVSQKLTDEIQKQTNPVIKQKLEPQDWLFGPFSKYGFSGALGTYHPSYEYDEDVIAYKILPNGETLVFNWGVVNSYGNKDFTYEKYLLPILSTFRFTK